MIQVNIAQANDMEGVLALQELNLVSNLSQEARKNGFVTTPFTTEELKTMIASEELFVAKDEQKIVAYVCTGSWQYFSQWAMFRYMATLFPIHSSVFGKITTENSFQYGPICIDSAYRGSGLLNSIFAFMQKNMAHKYPIGVTFINKVNTRSFDAHTKKLGIQVIDEFQFNGNHYFTLAFFTDIEKQKTIAKI